MRALSGVVIVAVLLGGCAKRVETTESSDSSGPAPALFYPLAVGNKWTYSANFLGQQREQTVEIVSREEDGFFLDNTGTSMTVDSYGVRDTRRYLLRQPIRDGAQWTNVVSVSSVEKYRILDASTSCDVPAGKFQSCVRVEARNRVDEKTTLVNEMTFAPNVGLVRVQVFAEAGGKKIPQTHLQLTSYELKGAP